MEATSLDAETEIRIALLFSPSDQERVRALLRDECGTGIPGWRMCGLQRLRFGVLKLSEGKLDKLERAVAIAKRDFRNVLVAAGFANNPEAHISWLPERRW